MSNADQAFDVMEQPRLGDPSFWKSVFGALVLIIIATPALPQDDPLSHRPPLLVPRGTETPSFNCTKAKSASARLICADGELARLDRELGTAFQNRKSRLSPADQSDFVADELVWIRDRNTRCDLVGKNNSTIQVLVMSKPCMANAILERIVLLQGGRETVNGEEFGSRSATEELLQARAKNGSSARFELNCASQNPLLRRECDLAQAILNHDCESLGSPSAKELCSSDLTLEAENMPSDPNDTYHPYMLQLGLQAGLHHLCDADFIPIVARECAIRRARIERLSAENEARVAGLRAQADINAKTEVEAAFRELGACVRDRIADLIGATETADAVVGAAIELCDVQLRKAARAVDYETDIKLWVEGPQPRGCGDNSPRCIDEEKAITDELLPRFSAKVMQARARAVHGTSDAPAPEIGQTSGTAFFISKEGLVLTNSHVVEHCGRILVRYGLQNGTAKLTARDAENDLAILATKLHPAGIAIWRHSIRQGEGVVVYGFPLTGVLADSGNITKGIVTALAGLGNDSRYLQISAPVQPGNSGGPLFDRDGNVVGVVVAKLDALKMATATGDIPQNVNFAIKASVVTAFLDAQHVDDAEQTSNSAMSTPDIAERAKAQTMQVICVQ